MKQLKLGILACAVIGLFTCFVGAQAIWKAHELPGVAKHIYMILAGFVAPLAVGIMAAAAPPMRRWQAGVALAGFALVLVKIRDGLFAGNFMNGKLMSIAVLAGVALAIAALIKPESEA